MGKKKAKEFRMAPLQKVRVREITDPTELAAIRERQKGGREEARRQEVLELFDAISAAERLRIATDLATQLSAEQRTEFLMRLAVQFAAVTNAANGTAAALDLVKRPRYKIGEKVRMRHGTPLVGLVSEARGTYHEDGNVLYRVRVPMEPEPLFMLVTEEEIEPVEK